MAPEIRCIAEHLDLVPTMARWHFREWGHLDAEGTLDTWTAGLAQRTRTDRVPTTFIAFVDESPVGSACLVEHDMETPRDLGPWLAGVFVLPEHRAQGVASALVARALSAARQFKVHELFLYTNGSESLYERLGWRPIGREFYEGQWVTLMSSLAGA